MSSKSYASWRARQARKRQTKAARKIQRRWRGKKSSALAKSNRRKINKLMNAEVSFRDLTINQSISSSGSFLQVGLQSIAQGDGDGQRQGDKITLRSLSFKATSQVFNGLIVNSDGFNNLRIILVKILQPNTNSPLQVTDILQVSDCKSFYKKKSDVKFKILHDKVYYMDNQGFGTGASSDPKWQPTHCHQKNCSFKIRFPSGMDVTYNTGTNTVYQNDLRLFCLSDSTAPGHPSLTGYFRLNYLP